MTRADLVASAALSSGHSLQDCGLVLDHLLDVLTGRLAMGRTIRLRGHMTLSAVTRACRPAFNMKTMQPMLTAERTAVRVRFPKGYLDA